MTAFAALPSHITVHAGRNYVSNGCFLPHSSNYKLQRRRSLRSLRVAQLSWNSWELSALCVSNPKVNPSPKGNSTRCYCLGTLINTDAATVSEWIPIVDQVLLMASICLTYMTGVIPAGKLLSSSRNGIPTDYARPVDFTLSGRATENGEEVNLKLPWDIVEEKLTDALNASEHRGNSGSRFVEFEQDRAKRPLSLYAVAEGPRFRLLWASFQWLKKEVANIRERSSILSMKDWSTVLSDVIQKSVGPVCVAWLEKELCLKSIKPDKEPLFSMVEKLMGNDTILKNTRNAGKEDLYAELAQFLIVSSPRRDGCCYDPCLFTQHGVAILEDMVITLADGISSVYLELISVDGNLSNEVNSGLMLCTLSTRELQKLRNEVALNQWLHQNMEAVVSMYEDRFDLCTLQSQLVMRPSKTNAENLIWWKKLMPKSGSVSSPFRYVMINHVSITVKRTKELRALTGWRYYFSLFLELADITMPVIRTVFSKVSDAISFFLVCLIGRSLGLIYTGIRQSLRWKS